MDEYFFTEVKPLFSGCGVRNRAPWFARSKQLLRKIIIPSVLAWIKVARDWIDPQLQNIFYPWEFLYRLEWRSMLFLFLGFLDRANRVFSWNMCSHSSRCDALPGKGLLRGPTTEQSFA
jgi:hypothetical protein